MCTRLPSSAEEIEYFLFLSNRELCSSKQCKYLNNTAENTHLLCKGKYHCTADLLFDWFGFSCFVELKL